MCQRSAAEESVAKIATAFIHKTVMLATCTILKIHRSELAPHLDLEAGEQAYFACIVFAREGSLQSNDLSARGATIFSQLWNSPNIFRGKDGKIDSLSSRISSRLSTSVVFDCLWWWRQEFGGSGNPYENRRQGKLALYFSLIWPSESRYSTNTNFFVQPKLHLRCRIPMTSLSISEQMRLLATTLPL